MWSHYATRWRRTIEKARDEQRLQLRSSTVCRTAGRTPAHADELRRAIARVVQREFLEEFRCRSSSTTRRSCFRRYRCYTHATEIRGDSRLLIISGLNGYLQDGRTMPESFEEQADIIWTHTRRRCCAAADMTVANLVSLRTYLADPKYDEANVRMRVKYLGTHAPSSTVICCQLLDPRWKLEVEAMAAT